MSRGLFAERWMSTGALWRVSIFSVNDFCRKRLVVSCEMIGVFLGGAFEDLISAVLLRNAPLFYQSFHLRGHSLISICT